ncbi:MAG: hypothetical protein U0Q11_04560 [Vicinamibacterales bacterium]
MNIDAAPPPSDVPGLVSRAAAVVRVTVTDTATVSVNVANASDVPPLPMTKVIGTVGEVFVKDSRLPSAGTVSFLVPGGEVDKGTHVERYLVPDTPAVEVGKTYLVFLGWYPAANSFSCLYGFGGLFEVNAGGKVVAYGRAPSARKLADQHGADDFQRLVREASRRR